jgi:hypothetical protein
MGSTVNRAYVYPSEWEDNWYATFTAMMDAIDADVAALQPLALTESIKIKAASPYVRFKGTENLGGDVRIIEYQGGFIFQKNVGTELVPSWSTLCQINSSGTVVLGVTWNLEEDTYENLKINQGTVKHMAWCTDLEQLMWFCGDTSKGDGGWYVI